MGVEGLNTIKNNQLPIGDTINEILAGNTYSIEFFALFCLTDDLVLFSERSKLLVIGKLVL